MKNSGDDRKSVLHQCLEAAVEAGGDRLEVEYKDGEDIVFCVRGNTGFSIAAFSSNSSESSELLEELDKRDGKTTKVEISGNKYSLKVESYDSFGETAYSVQIRRA